MTDTHGPDASGAAPERLEVVLNRLLVAMPQVTIATAESCTGGFVAHRITSVSGSSVYFLGGIVAYANAAKIRLLGVPEAIIESHGAVSAECSVAMAEGARQAFGASIAVSTTGIAGPTGGTARKPVGLVYLAYASPAGTGWEEHHFSGNRLAVIHAASEVALRLLIEQAQRALRAASGAP
jgi:PncC family amidohydrolase